MLGFIRFQALVLVLAGLLLAGCDGKQPPQDQTPGESAEFSFRFNSHALGSNATGGSMPQALVTLDGQLLVVPDGGNPAAGDGTVYTFELQVDESAAQITTVIPLELAVGAYDIYFLLNTPTLQHAGIEVNHLILSGGLNTITISLNPVMDGPVASVRDLAALSAFTVRYDPTVLATYAYPRIGLAVDGAAEEVFDVVPNASDPVITLFLSPGLHQVSVRFFDGAIVRTVPADPTPVEPAPPGEAPTEIPLVPLTAEATYTYTDSGSGGASGVADFNFTVPTDVIAEVTGDAAAALTNLKAVASIVGAENPLVEAQLTLSPVTDPSTGAVLHYAGSLSIAGFVPGSITWQLSFVDLLTNEEFAYCAETVDTTDTPSPGSGSFLCDLNLLVRAETSVAPVGTVDVTVTDSLGLVAGAVVLLNGEPLGITGGGTSGEPLGNLIAFLEPGEYSLQVVQQMLDPFGSGQIVTRTSETQTITVVGNTTGAVLSVAVTLPGFPFGAPQVTGISPADGATDVPVDASIAVTYSQKMDRASAEAGFHTTPSVPGTFSWSAGDTVLTFRPDSLLAYQQSYKVTIDASSEDVAGTQLKSGRVFWFTTGLLPDEVAPTVTGVTPASGANNVDVASIVTLTFSEAMDTGATEQAFGLSPATAGTLSWSGGNTVLTFLPGTGLAYDTAYTVTMGTGARDTAGNPLAAAFSSAFSTGVEPDQVAPTVVSVSPGANDSSVSVTAKVVVTFSEAMDTSTVESAFNLQPTVSGNFGWSVGNTVLTFTAGEPLAHDTEYRLTVGTAALDTAGNALAEQLWLRFRTVKPPPPSAYLTVEAGRTMRPRRFLDGFIDLSEPVTVRIPGLEDLSLVNDDNGNPLGDPEQFLLFLTLGDVKCMYLAGQWDRHIGGIAEDFFEESFKAPVCGRHRAGDIVTIQPGEGGGSSVLQAGQKEPRGEGQYPDRDAEIKARVVTGNPHFDETRVQVRIELVQP